MSVDIIKDIVAIKVDFNGKKVAVPVVWYEDTSMYELSASPGIKYRRSLFATLGFIFTYKDLLEDGGVEKTLNKMYKADKEDDFSFHTGVYFDSLGKRMTWKAWKNRWLRAFDYAVTPEEFVKAMPFPDSNYEHYVTATRSVLFRYLSGETLDPHDLQIFTRIGADTIRGYFSRRKPSSIIREKIFGKEKKSSPKVYKVEVQLPNKSVWYSVLSLGNKLKYTMYQNAGRKYTKAGALGAATRIVSKYNVQAARVVDNTGRVIRVEKRLLGA